MNLFDRARASLSAAVAAWSGPGDVRQWPGFVRYLGPTNSAVRVDDEIAQTTSAVWGCVSGLADSVSQAEIGLYEVDGPNSEQITDHPVAAILANGFNPDLSTQLGVYTGQTQVGLTGNAYLAIRRGARGEPESLHFLDPYATCPKLAENVPYDIVAEFETKYQGREYRYIPEDICHIRGHTTRGVYGISPITAAREAIGLALAEEKYGATFFANDGRSGGYIMQPADTNTRSKRAKQDEVAGGGPGGQGGPDRAHMPKILDPGAKYIPVTISQADSQYLESRAFQIADIARFYRYPLVFLDSSSQTAWGAGIEQIKIGFVEFTVNPLADRWESELTRKLLTPEERAKGLRVRFNTTVLLQGDMAARGEYINKRILNGSLTRNEARAREGDNPLPGLDVPLIPVNMQDGRKPPTPAQPTKPQQTDEQPQGNDNASPND